MILADVAGNIEAAAAGVAATLAIMGFVQKQLSKREDRERAEAEAKKKADAKKEEDQQKLFRTVKSHEELLIGLPHRPGFRDQPGLVADMQKLSQAVDNSVETAKKALAMATTAHDAMIELRTALKESGQLPKEGK
jgi:hypothetical protein